MQRPAPVSESAPRPASQFSPPTDAPGVAGDLALEARANVPASTLLTAALAGQDNASVMVPYPPGTHLPMQMPLWLRSAKLHLPTQRRNRWALPGTLETGEPADLPWQDEASALTLAQELARQPLPLDIARVPLGSPSLEALRKAFRGCGWVHLQPAGGSPFIALDTSWHQPESHFNAGRQSDFRRARRRAQAAGELGFEVLTPAPGAGLDPLLAQAYEVESRSWKGTGGTALVHDKLLGPFYRSLSHAAAQEGLLRLCFMRIDGRPVAMQLALQFERRFWLMKIGFDAAFARCSPGQLLMLHTIGHAAMQGLDSYEMLGSAAPWTATWTRTLRPFVRVRAYPASWAGARAFWVDTLGAARRRWPLRRWPWVQRLVDGPPVELTAPRQAL